MKALINHHAELILKIAKEERNAFKNTPHTVIIDKIIEMITHNIERIYLK
jgi:hypothetical protein